METKVEPPADDGVDVTLIRWALSMTPEERLLALQSFIDGVVALRNAQKRT